MQLTAGQIVTDALTEIGVLGAGQTPAAADMQLGIRKLNYRYDEWRSEDAYAYNVDFQLFTLPTNTQPVTIGPDGADFDVDVRPVKVEAATLVFGGTNPPVEIPLNMRNDQWWANQSVKTLTSSLSTDLYYSPNWPNGSLYFWPISTQVHQVRLEIWVLLPEIASQSTMINLPPAYANATMLTLAEDLLSPFGKNPPPALGIKAQRARMAVQGNNIQSPLTATTDSGMPNKARPSPDFNWLTGSPSK